MRVRVDEARHHGLSTEIDLSNAGSREIHHVRVFPNGEKSATRYSYSFCNRLGGIHRHDGAVLQNGVRFFLFGGEKGGGGNRAYETTARRSGRHKASSSTFFSSLGVTGYSNAWAGR